MILTLTLLRGFPRPQSVHGPWFLPIVIIIISRDVTKVTLGASGYWLGSQTGAGDTATLA